MTKEDILEEEVEEGEPSPGGGKAIGTAGCIAGDPGAEAEVIASRKRIDGDMVKSALRCRVRTISTGTPRGPAGSSWLEREEGLRPRSSWSAEGAKRRPVRTSEACSSAMSRVGACGVGLRLRVGAGLLLRSEAESLAGWLGPGLLGRSSGGLEGGLLPRVEPSACVGSMMGGARGAGLRPRSAAVPVGATLVVTVGEVAVVEEGCNTACAVKGLLTATAGVGATPLVKGEKREG